MNTAILKPRPGYTVRDPQTGAKLAADGEEKPLTTFWRRRIKDGDVTSSAKPAANKAKGE